MEVVLWVPGANTLFNLVQILHHRQDLLVLLTLKRLSLILTPINFIILVHFHHEFYVVRNLDTLDYLRIHVGNILSQNLIDRLLQVLHIANFTVPIVVLKPASTLQESTEIVTRLPYIGSSHDLFEVYEVTGL